MCRINAILLKQRKCVVNLLDRNRVFSPKELPVTMMMSRYICGICERAVPAMV
jgi:hypothetical protein